jgi:hypothetical protein
MAGKWEHFWYVIGGLFGSGLALYLIARSADAAWDQKYFEATYYLLLGCACIVALSAGYRKNKDSK